MLLFRNILLILLSLGLSMFSYAKNNEFKVLAYHSVIDESVQNNQSYYFPQTISANQLISHFNWLKDNGYHVISWKQIINARNGKNSLPDKSVLLSFDDGYKTMYNVVYPLLQAYNYPAVFAPVGSWLDTPSNKNIQYTKEQSLPRSAFVTWAEVAEMKNSGLVEIASHTYNLHYGTTANPANSEIPAIITPHYKNQKYETISQYQQRLTRDFLRSSQAIKKYTRTVPQIMVWPYGQFNDEAIKVAQKVGLNYHFSLNSLKVNTPDDLHVGRFLIDAETELSTLKEYLENELFEHNIQHSLYVDLDDIYHNDQTIQKQNIDKLIQNIYDAGVNVVYVKPYSDINHDNLADVLYFPNSQLPVKADLLSLITWQLARRGAVSVYIDLPYDVLNHTKNIEALYQELSFYNKFSGIISYEVNASEKIQDLPISDFNKIKIASHRFTNIELENFQFIAKIKIKGDEKLDLSLVNNLLNNFSKVSIIIDTDKNTKDDSALTLTTKVLKQLTAANINKNSINIQLKHNNLDIDNLLKNWINLVKQYQFHNFGFISNAMLYNNDNYKAIIPSFSLKNNIAQ